MAEKIVLGLSGGVDSAVAAARLRAQGFDGQFDEGEVGYSVVCGDIAQQAARIADLCEDYEARSVRCIERSKAYAWPNVTAKWAAFYGRALRG